MKNYLKRTTTFLLALLMLLSVPLQAFAEVDHNNLSKDKAEIINKKEPPLKPAKLEGEQTAADLIKDPDQPAIYTLRTDYKVQRGEKYEVDYQPYIASVGEDASDEEKAKVNKEITLPELAGYDKSHLNDTYTIDYDTVKSAAEGKNESGNDANGKRYQAKEDYKYKAKANQIKIKHVFQDLYDFSKYTNPDGSVGEEGQLITTQNGNTGSTMEVTPLEEKDRKGFVPEADSINMQVPENAENFILEYRYNRAHYDVNFDTKGGTALPNRNLYYEQIIPTIDDKSIPTKAGSEFQGWKPSVELKSKDGNTTYKAGETIKNNNGDPVLDLDANLKMPASKITFTAVWKEKPKAEYVIQFWTEKTDYDDKDKTLPLRDRYDFIGSRRVDNADTGSRPDLTNLDIHNITFPDLNDGRLEKAQDNKDEFERYYFLNEDLTKKQNASEDNPDVQKSVLSTGETVYNVYYDRRVYTLYFTAPNEAGWDPGSSYWPTLTRNGQVIGKKGSPYKVEARFNQSLDKIWPKDKEISGLPPASSAPGADMGPIGWTINVNEPGELIFRDTPPYRLSAEDFIDSEDVEEYGLGHGDQIPIGENQTKARDKYEISLASSSWDESVVHHIDIIKDDFEGNEQIDYDLSYWKSDTNVSYAFILPHLQGFTLKEETRDAEWVLAEPTTSKYRTINDVNRARNKKTPFRSDADKIEYIDKFPWGTKLFDGKNRYNFANYTRNKYKLKLNNDPKTVKNDSEYGEGNILDVPYEFPLNDLKLDTTHKPEKPDWVRDDWSFLGWALDPSGNNLVKDGKETKLHYDQILYAKWGEPDYKWKVIFDPNGGSLRTIDENKLTTERKTVKEGDIGQEKETTYPIKEPNDGNKQVFKVVHKQKLVEPKFKPVRKGYDFMGWEIIRYKKDDKTGDYTEEIDNSYRETYKVPELYSFGNDVVSPIYLKAIWVPNARVDVKVEHYMLDKDYNLVEKLEDTLEGKRANYLVATTGDRQDDKYTLVPHDELDEKLTGDLKTIYEEYNDRVKLNNSFFQTFRVEPEKILNTETNQMEDNPKVVNNVFKFFYRPYRQREYKVNYIDENFKGKENEKAGAIITQELVVNGNRHYDARNYRPIPGWKLVSAPQQQLFFDLNEETNEFLGINGTGSDEITFYYKDVRVIEVPEDGETPEGYVRVTFKADKGGTFTDNTGKSVTELHYDVIKGLKSDLLPVPKLLEEGEEKVAGKYYITPETGKKFTKWDEKPLLNKNTIVENEDKDFYVFTAKFEWSGLTASGLVRTEAFKDPEGKWTNNFAPTLDDLEKQLVWKEKDKETKLPEGTTIKFFDEDGKELKSNEDVFNLVKEMNAADKDELVRTVNITVKATFKDGKEPQELVIPITVYKNVYEALNKEGDKPLFLTEAEGKDAKDGGLKDILKDNDGNRYIKVTIKPNKDFTNKDDKVYYVNPNAWVEIPEVKTEGDSNFTNWTADIVGQNDDGKKDGIFNFSKRHKFTEDTIITPVGAGDVVEQTEGEDKPKVPDNYVKVIVDKTTKAELGAEEKQTQTFWVNPTKEVTIEVTNPTGKENQKFTFDELGEKDVNYIFKEWQKVKAGEADDKLTDVTPEKIDLSSHKYTDKITVIEAAYKKSIQAETIDKPLSTSKLDTPQGKEITDEILKEKITPQEGKEIESIEVISKPDGNTVGDTPAKVIVKYKDGSTQGTNDNPVVIPVEVHKNIIPEVIPGQKPDGAMDNYVKVIFKAGTGGSLSGDLVYYVSPEVEVDMTESAGKVTKTPSVGYTSNGGSWSPEIKSEKITAEKTYEFNFVKSEDIVEKTDDPNQVIPKGYVKVTFKTEDEAKGKLDGNVKEKIYYVNPNAGITLKVLEEGQTATAKQLAVPTPTANDNFTFKEWQENIDETTPITSERVHVAIFMSGQVTLTYDKGGEDVTGDLPASVTANYGATVGLAGKGTLTKPNAEFAGWKLDGEDKIYQPGDQVTLEKSRTATAQWKSSAYTVSFNSMGGSNVDSQTVEHGKTATEPKSPTLDGKVFMGWKEKETDTSYFDFNTPITADKTLIAIWQDPVQKIGENDTVEEQFIKVTFNEGKHGTLRLGQENKNSMSYKVAKELTFMQAFVEGKTLPEIIADKYFKAIKENGGWDKERKLNGQDIDFTAQYEPIADVIPVDPEVTDEEQIQKEKPEGMVLVTFSVDENKAFMVGDTKFYVKANTKVDIPTPVVHPRTLENDEPNDYEFKGWSYEKDAEGRYNFIFTEDTSINDGNLVKPIITLRHPRSNATVVYVSEITEGATGYIEIIRGSNPPVLIEASINSYGDIVFNVPGELGGKLKRRDKIRAYSKLNNVESDIREYRVR